MRLIAIIYTLIGLASLYAVYFGARDDIPYLAHFGMLFGGIVVGSGGMKWWNSK